jgi:hypothetical protein
MSISVNDCNKKQFITFFYLYEPDEDKLYIKIIALDEIYNSVVEKFLNWNCLGSQNIVVSAQILKFKI